jgi:tetratricopeptide (TPR) repeat protein
MDIVVRREGQFAGATSDVHASEPELIEARIVQISSWMMILGTIRLISTMGAYGSSLLEVSHFRVPSLRLLTYFFQEYPPAFALGFAWPLVVALILRRTSSHVFLRASAITFFILSLGGFLNLMTGLLFRTDSQVLVGSLSVSRWALLQLHGAALLRASIGLAQMTLELLVARSAWMLANSSAQASIEKRVEGHPSRRRLQGRMAVYVALAFLVINVRHTVWSAYLEVLNESSLVREFVLKSDAKPHVTYYHRGVIASRNSGPDPEFEPSLGRASTALEAKRWPEARDVYLQIIKKGEAKIADASETRAWRAGTALALNNLAWLLATCEDKTFQSPQEAVSYARKAVELMPAEGNYWNTLGVAAYRVQDYVEARRSLERSIRIRGDGEGDAYDWFFMAMIQARLGDPELGRRWYDRAVAWYRPAHEGDPELYRFQVEAADLLNLRKPAPPGVSAQTGPRPGLAGKRMRRPPTINRLGPDEG